MQGLHDVFSHIELFADFLSKYLHTAQMAVGSDVFGINRKGEGFNSAQMEVSHLRNVGLFLSKAVQIESVASLHKKKDGQNQN